MYVRPFSAATVLSVLLSSVSPSVIASPSTQLALLDPDLRLQTTVPTVRISLIGEGNQTGAAFGTSLASAGDVNADGYADIIVGLPNYSNGQSQEGEAYVYYGSAAGLPRSPNWTREGNQSTAGLGTSVSSAGDVNGDGYDDVIIGAPYYSVQFGAQGQASVFYGSPAGLSNQPAWNAQGVYAGEYFGYVVAAAGDINGDGYDDVIVGSPYYDTTELNVGQVNVYYGSATGLSPTPDWTQQGSEYFNEYGYSIAGAGDVNGDGFADIIVGENGYGSDEEGAAFVYYGSATGLSPTPDWTAVGEPGAVFGYSVDTAGDVNGDGFADVIAGGIGYSEDSRSEGVAQVYFGSASGLSLAPDWETTGHQAYSYYGGVVSTAGDLNGDGYDEVMASAPDYNHGQATEGRVFFFFGSPAGPSTTPNATIESNQVAAGMATALALAGDINGDGVDDALIGDGHYARPQLNEGIALVVYGGR